MNEIDIEQKNYSTVNLYLCELLVQKVNDGSYYPVRSKIPRYILAYEKYDFRDPFSIDPYYKDLFSDNRYRHYNEYKSYDGEIVVMPVTLINTIADNSEISYSKAKKILNTANNSKKKSDMKEYLKNFKKLAKEYPEEAKKIATEVLIETGVLDKKGNSKEQIVTKPQCGYSKRIKVKINKK